MFTLNGIVYASEKPENIQILSAKPLDDMMMLLTFSTGEQRLFDATILNGPAFAPLSDEKIFKDCKVVDGIVTWMDEDMTVLLNTCMSTATLIRLCSRQSNFIKEKPAPAPTGTGQHIRRCTLFSAKILYHLRGSHASGTFVRACCYFYTYFYIIIIEVIP